MTSLILVYKGPPEQKHGIKVPPMATLEQYLVEACAKFRPALDPAHCRLHLNKAAVDLGTPLRLLNLPAGTKLEVVLGAPRAGAAGSAATASAPSSSAPGASTAMAASAQAQPPPGSSAADQDATTVSAGGPGSSAGPSQSQPAIAESVQPPPPSAAAAAAAAGPSSTTAVVAPPPPAEPPAVPPELAALGVTRPLLVFSQAALERAAEAAAPSTRPPDLPEDFYELTAEDLAALAAHKSQRAKADATFRTRAMRESERSAAAAAYGPVRLRLHFPGGVLVQAAFQAADTLADVKALAAAITLPPLRPGLYLYTTPPKTLLKDKDLGATLYAAQLVPAAHIHVGFQWDKCGGEAQAAGPLLQPAVQALLQQELPPEVVPSAAVEQTPGSDSTMQAAGSSAVRAAAAAVTGAGAGTLSAAAGGAGSAPGAKVPKWLKLGKS